MDKEQGKAKPKAQSKLNLHVLRGYNIAWGNVL